VSGIASTNHREDAGGPPPRRFVRLQKAVAEILRGEDDRRLAQRTALLAYVIRAVAAVLALVLQILLARWLGTSEYGVYSFAFVTLVVVGALLPIGFPTAAQRFIAEYTETGKTGLLLGFLDGSRMFMLALGTAVAGIGALGLWLFGAQMDQHYILPLYLMLICLPVYGLMEVQDGIARNYSWIDLALALPYLVRPLIIVAIVGTTLLVTGSADAITASMAMIGAIWITSVLQSILLELRLRRKVSRVERAYDWKSWIVTSLPIFLVEGFYMLLTNTDVLVVSIYEPPDQVGIYFATVKILALVNFVPFAVTAAAAHKYAEYGASGDKAKLDSFVRDTVVWTFWPALIITVAMLVAGRPLLWLFGPEFVDGYPLLFILVLGLMARATVGPADRVLNMLGQQNVCALIYAGAFAINLVLNFTLIPLFGLVGAAWATSLALIVESILLFMVARSRLGLHVFILDTRRRSVSQSGT
jgi:O-antigen/teichoic acid export membrane protein